MTCQGDVSRMGQCSLLFNELNWTHYKKQKQMSLKYSLEKKLSNISIFNIEIIQCE